MLCLCIGSCSGPFDQDQGTRLDLVVHESVQPRATQFRPIKDLRLPFHTRMGTQTQCSVPLDEDLMVVGHSP
jgi:hypothetical protein